MMSLNALVAIALLAAAASASAQNAAPLRQYLIEREIKGAGNMTPVQLQDAARKSNGVLRALGPDIQWVHSYVAGDKIYCVYNAPSDALKNVHRPIPHPIGHRPQWKPRGDARLGKPE